ncbi:MAG TPA: hypothetical protein IAC31_09520 [Candidatus Faecousia intestinigallinarum]|nr:hypothetical protein [Candidatus Faecousia intestinigallinarum]
MEKGKLLVSTRTNGWGKKIFFLLGALICAFAGSNSLSHPEFFFQFSWSNYKIIAYLFAICCMLGFGFSLGAVLSYCEVYEHGVVGRTQITFRHGWQKFDVRYSDILNVTESGPMVLTITAQYGKYTVYTFSNHEAALQEIRTRMKGGAA